MLKVLHDGDYKKYVNHQKSKLDSYLAHNGKRTALEKLAKKHYEALLKRLINYDLRGKNVLCLAARLGQEVRAFRDSGAFAVGVDLNPGPDNYYVHHGDFHDLPFSKDSVDIIYTNSLDHVFDLGKVIKEMKRVLHDQGQIILEIQEGEDAGVKAEQYEACWWDSVDDALVHFKKEGLNIQKITPIEVPFKAAHVLMSFAAETTQEAPVAIEKQIDMSSRETLAKAAEGIAVELGVAAGDYSECLLKNHKISRLYSIDSWDSGKHLDEEYLAVMKRFSEYGKRSIIVRKTFEEACAMFTDELFDFIYVDGYAHTGQDEGKTLHQWWTKLKPGGIFAGHDYHPKWQPTVDVVNKFVADKGLKLHLTGESKAGLFPSWYVIKP